MQFENVYVEHHSRQYFKALFLVNIYKEKNVVQ